MGGNVETVAAANDAPANRGLTSGRPALKPVEIENTLYLCRAGSVMNVYVIWVYLYIVRMQPRDVKE